MNRSLPADALIGAGVSIRSAAGIVYRGVIKAIRPHDGTGEFFELGSAGDPGFQRFVFVSDRERQITTEAGRTS